MTNSRGDDLLSELRRVATRTLHSAGPRYAPSLDPRAPNLAIVPLQRAGDALAQGSAFRERVEALSGGIRKAHDRDEHFANGLFERRVASVQRIIADLDALASADTVVSRRTAVRGLRRHLRSVRGRLTTTEDELRARLRALEETKSETESEEEKKARSSERERVQSRLGAIRRLEEALYEVAEFSDGHEGDLVADGSSILLLGEWGTGKTHFLCDYAVQAIEDGTPTLVVLASALRTDIPPLDAIAEVTGLAPSGAALMLLLDARAKEARRRALIMIDAINESDRAAWRRALPGLVRDVADAGNIGLVVSCRTPFDSSVVADTLRKRMTVLRHPGFEDQEFDAQLEFFKYYDLPALHVPLLTSEFSRPLFLRLMCEGIKDLGKRSQKNRLRDLASGQKSMTYVLERFVKEVGEEVEKAHNISKLSCWHIMKGDPRNGRAGLAGVLASERREWLSRDEALDEVRACTGATLQEAGAIIDSMKTAGLLIEHSRYQDGGYVDVLVLPYQRFSDHLVARHLLDAHLDTTSAERLRRCFYKNQRLGAVFVVDRWGREFAEPGIASALMIEFPERVRRMAERDGSPTELLFHIPKERRLVHPVVDVFLEGLYWRPSSSFGPETRWMVEFLLRREERELRSRVYEVVVGLAVRDGHPLGSRWLIDRIAAMSMADRDIEWSEFVRTADPDSNLHRLLAWAEREEHSKVDVEVTAHAIRLTALLLTTTDRLTRDRATRALVLMGEAHPRRLFDEVSALLSFGDPYVTERVLAACYGVCMRVWATMDRRSNFGDDLARLARLLLEQVLRPGSCHSTWHALTRGYAIGVLQILLKLRPRALSSSDRSLLVPSPGHAVSPFRPVSRIRKRDVDDPEHAIHMDFGNYTIGRLVDDRGNYDFKHKEYAGVRKQIADRMRRLGYSTARFNDVDKIIVRYLEYRRDGYQVDRYGKKYSWIAFFEMYGLRRAEGRFKDDYFHEPRPSDSDIDPSFPEDIKRWTPPGTDVFAVSPTDLHGWIANGQDPDYASLLKMSEVDGIAGDWILLDAAMHEGVADGREARGWVTSVFVPPRSVDQMRKEVNSGRDLGDRGFPDNGADYYTYHGEVPWSAMYGSDVRTGRGLPRRLNDRAFDYFDSGWKRGILVEDSCRRWSWEDYHSQLNQVGGVVFPAPPIAEALNLRVAGGSSDMLDEKGKVATIFRRTDGPGFGSFFLYMRRDLVERYVEARRLRLVQAVVTERNVSYKAMEGGLPDSLRAVFQSRVQISGQVFGLE
ncbi:MAG: hypothetical protein V9G13_15020 [Marmoricola sp.]